MSACVQSLLPSIPSRFVISSGEMNGRSFQAVLLGKIGCSLSTSRASLADFEFSGSDVSGFELFSLSVAAILCRS